jgi:hypothetical protein
MAVNGEWVKTPPETKPYLASVGNTVSFEFPGGTNGIIMIGIFAAGIIIGFMLCTYKTRK